MVMALFTFSSGLFQSASLISQCYQSRVIQYEDFLEQNFDGTTNCTSPLTQIYQTSVVNNEVYNISKMLKQPDKFEFMKAMHEKVSSILTE